MAGAHPWAGHRVLVVVLVVVEACEQVLGLLLAFALQAACETKQLSAVDRPAPRSIDWAQTNFLRKHGTSLWLQRRPRGLLAPTDRLLTAWGLALAPPARASQGALMSRKRATQPSAHNLRKHGTSLWLQRRPRGLLAPTDRLLTAYAHPANPPNVQEKERPEADPRIGIH
eukprot:COSAG06_NODE_8687_length_2096_cov_46.839760_1_plen_170_part_10